MTARKLIKVLQGLEKKYPGLKVYVDVESRNKNMDGDWTYRWVTKVKHDCVEKGDDDGFLATNARGETISNHIIILEVN